MESISIPSTRFRLVKKLDIKNDTTGKNPAADVSSKRSIPTERGPIIAESFSQVSEHSNAQLQESASVKQIKFHNIEDVLKEISNDNENVFILGLGTTWCYPCKKSFKHLYKFSELKKQQKLKVFLLDQEKNRDFCRKQGIIVGTPVIMMYYCGKEMVFSRGASEPSNKLKGLVNLQQIEELWSSTLVALEMHAREIHVIF